MWYWWEKKKWPLKMNMFEITIDQHMDMIEYAGNTLDKHDSIDNSAPSLVEVCVSFFFSWFFFLRLLKQRGKKWKFLIGVCSFCIRVQVTGISQHHMATASGLNDYDYQNLSNLTMGLKNLNQLELVSKIPIPPEIMEHFRSNSTLNWLILNGSMEFVDLIVCFFSPSLF